MKLLKEALEEAFQVNSTLPLCPATRECSLKYPQVDLLGRHSIIDTAFTYRTMLIDAACQNQPELTSREAHRLLNAAKPQKYEMEQAASMLHILELADVLHDLSKTPDYQNMKKHLMALPVLREYHKSVSAAEHMAGLRDTNISNHLLTYCSETLGHPFSMEAYHMRNIIPLQEAQKMLPPPDQTHVTLCAHYAEPAVLKTALRKTKSEPAL